jgi:hypothetical protein
MIKECGMIRCVVPRGSSTAKLLRAANRRYTSPAIPSTLDELEREYGVSKPNPIPSPDTGRPVKKQRPPENYFDGSSKKVEGKELQDGEQGVEHATSRPAGSNGKPAKRREFPISPYMDSHYISTKEKYYGPKSPPAKNPTEFQKALAKNPYALALATPVRTCHATGTLLPRYFLQDFGVMGHPETKEPYWVPRSLTSKYYSGPMAESEGADSTTPGSALGDGESKSDESGAEERSYVEPTDSSRFAVKEASSSSPSLGPRAYTLARKALVEGFSKGGFLEKGRYLATAAGTRPRDRPVLRRIVEGARVRSDMDSLMLELMRRRVVEEFEYLVPLKAYIRACKGWDDATKSSRQPGALLWTGPIRSGELEEEPADDKEARIRGPPEFATLKIGTVKSRKVPVHNLETLLGKDHLQRLKEKCPLFDAEILMVRHKNVTVDIQLKLWRLQGYLAKYEQFLD